MEISKINNKEGSVLPLRKPIGKKVKANHATETGSANHQLNQSKLSTKNKELTLCCWLKDGTKCVLKKSKQQASPNPALSTLHYTHSTYTHNTTSTGPVSPFRASSASGLYTTAHNRSINNARSS